MKKYIFLFFVLLVTQVALADDTEIYGVSTINVKPNVLIVFDSSGSMSTQDVPSEQYDPAVTYSGSYSTSGVYRVAWGGYSYFFNDITSTRWHDATSQNSLLTQGYWRGRVYRSGNATSGQVYAGGWSYSYRTGNYINFLNQSSVVWEKRMVVAKNVIAKLIYDNADSVNFGVMKFHHDQGGFIVEPCGATTAELIGNYDPATTTFTDSDQHSTLGAIGGMYSSGMTPIAETMAEAGLYFAGEHGWFNNVDYTSPIKYRCQKNYIILVTDGAPTSDDALIGTRVYLNGKLIPSEGHDGSPNYLEDVTYFLANNDLRTDLGSTGDFSDQTVTTYTIGFTGQLDYLEQAATNGNGEYYPADSAATLGEALDNILSSIGESNEQFSSSAVPVNSDDGFTAGDFVYFGLFQPLSNNNWVGNLKKYSLEDGIIKDVNGNEAVLSTGAFADNATSFWSSRVDGNDVTTGGAGDVLSVAIENGTARNIYTYTGTDNDLTESSNLFVTANSALTSAGLSPSLISAVRHENSDGTWPLGSFIHSEPLVVHYSSTQTMIYIGANDGMLHCFDDADGSEKWGFVPPDLFANLNVLESPTQLYYFVDGSPTLYSYDNGGTTQRILIFGERRGGYGYTALDVTNPSSPQYKYHIGSGFLIDAGGSESLGQSWGKPQRCRMFDHTTNAVKDVFLIPGGYDTNQDNIPVVNADTMGRAVFAVDSRTGALFPGFNFNHSDFGSMDHSIVAAAAFENPESRTATRVYAGDLGGNLFAARDDTYTGEENGVWEQKIKLFSSGDRKIFYPPNITNEYFWVKYPFSGTRSDPPAMRRIKGDYVFYGTGDRAHPNRTDIVNEFYAIKNSWQWEDENGAPVTEPDIVKAFVDTSDGLLKEVGTTTEIGDDDLFILDVTDDLLQNTETDATTRDLYTNYIKSAINNKNNRGWYFRLEEIDGSTVGEKVVSSPIIFAGAVYFTTYVPDNSTCSTSDPCANPGSSGIGYLYAIDYKNGGAVLNLSGSNTGGALDRSDRRIALKTTGIPPEPRIVTPKKGDPFLIIGKQKVDLPPLKGVNLFYWRQLNN